MKWFCAPNDSSHIGAAEWQETHNLEHDPDALPSSLHTGGDR
jgi:hypothetical protein